MKEKRRRTAEDYIKQSAQAYKNLLRGARYRPLQRGKRGQRKRDKGAG